MNHLFGEGTFMSKLKGIMPFFFSFMLFMAASNFVHPVTPTLIRMYGLPDNTFGVAYAAMCFMNFLFSPFWGKMNDHFHIRTTLTVCTLGYALGQFFFLMAHDRTSLIFARAFAGVFTGGCYTSFFSYIVHHTNEETRPQALTFYAAAQVIAGAVGFFIGGRLGELGAYACIWTQIFAEAVVALLFFLTCKKEKIEEKKKEKPQEIIRTANPFAAFYAGRKFLNVSWLILFLICMFEYLGYVGFDQSFNYFLKERFDFSPSVNGNLKLIISVAKLMISFRFPFTLGEKSNLSFKK